MNSYSKQPSLIELLSDAWPEGVAQLNEFCENARYRTLTEEPPSRSQRTLPAGWPEELCNQQSKPDLLPVGNHPIREEVRIIRYARPFLPRRSRFLPNYNHFITPEPEQLLMASMMLGFRCTRSRDMLMIMQRLNATSERSISSTNSQNLEVLKRAQWNVLNRDNWKAFFRSIRLSGYTGGRLVSAETNLIFSYVLFLIGKTECRLSSYDFELAIARWFFVLNLTRRYSTNSEAKMASDLANFRGIRDSDEFLAVLTRVCDSGACIMDDEYWVNTLPKLLETSSVTSSFQFAYWASLILLGANALGSLASVSRILNSSIHSKYSPIATCDWFFSKEHIDSLKDAGFRTANRVGNFVLTECSVRTSSKWGEVAFEQEAAKLDQEVAKLSELTVVGGNGKLIPEREKKILSIMRPGYPDEIAFDSEMVKLLTAEQLRRINHWLDQRMLRWHALPNEWESMHYGDFLKERSKLISGVIREAYSMLVRATLDGRKGPQELIPAEHLLRERKEFNDVEFRPTLRKNIWTRREDIAVELSSLRIIAGFLNSNGGTLILGVSRYGRPQMSEDDIFETRDRMWLHLLNLLHHRVGTLPFSAQALRIPLDLESLPDSRNGQTDEAISCIHPRFERIRAQWVLRIDCVKSNAPVYLKEANLGRFFVRTDFRTKELGQRKAREYFEERFPDWQPKVELKPEMPANDALKPVDG